MALTETQIRHLADTTPLWYDQIAALSDRAERYGMRDAAFLALVAGACVAETGRRCIALAVMAGVDAWREKQREGRYRA